MAEQVKTCSYRGQEYLAGVEVCEREREKCMRCRIDGEWESFSCSGS
jgi:hypothetical protein